MNRHLSDKQRWMLNLSALLAQHNGLGCETLELGDFRNEKYIMDWRRSFKRDWGVESKRDLLETLEWLRGSGHKESYRRIDQYWSRFSEPQFYRELNSVQNEKERRQIWLVYLHRMVLRNVGISAWDYGRHVFLCRQGYYLGLLTETETWTLIEPVADTAQQLFHSWEQFGTSYIVGRLFWIGGSVAESVCDDFFSPLNVLLGNEKSDWNQLNWRWSSFQ